LSIFHHASLQPFVDHPPYNTVSLRSQIKAPLHGTLPASAIGKACNYTLSLRQKLTRFLEHPQLELSNNLPENTMRPIALGRKNWIHLGSQHTGPKIAAILSVMETCKRRQIPVRDYLAHVLPRLANLPATNSTNSHLPPGKQPS
jgi:transposase